MSIRRVATLEGSDLRSFSRICTWFRMQYTFIETSGISPDKRFKSSSVIFSVVLNFSVVTSPSAKVSHVTSLLQLLPEQSTVSRQQKCVLHKIVQFGSYSWLRKQRYRIFTLSSSFFIKVSLSDIASSIDNEVLHTCVKPHWWWVDRAEVYFKAVKWSHDTTSIVIQAESKQ